MLVCFGEGGVGLDPAQPSYRVALQTSLAPRDPEFPAAHLRSCPALTMLAPGRCTFDEGRAAGHRG